MKKNIGCRVQLQPAPCRLDKNGQQLPPVDDDWIIEDVSDAGVRIARERMGHVTTLGKDHIHHFTTNPERSQGGIRYGFLTLNVQVFLQGTKLWVRPTTRPGEPVKPDIIQVHEKWVDFNYPRDSGLQQRLEASGYRIAWSLEEKLSRRTDLEGWEVVVEPDVQGVPTKFRFKDRFGDQTLIKKLES